MCCSLKRTDHSPKSHHATKVERRSDFREEQIRGKLEKNISDEQNRGDRIELSSMEMEVSLQRPDSGLSERSSV
jgi:hypothetical protein